MSANLTLSLTATVPTDFKQTEFVKLWDSSNVGEKANLLLFIARVNCCKKDIIIPSVPGHIYVSRSPAQFKALDGNNNTKYFEFTSLRDNGTTFFGKITLTSIYNYDKDRGLLKAVVRSFPPKTFEWDVIFNDDQSLYSQ